MIRSESLKCLDLDIIGVAETHLRDDIEPYLSGYSVFTHNRTHLHKRAKTGSGGVCLFVKKHVMEMCNVSILDNTMEDILWVELRHKYSSFCINICVCYLSPEGSSRYVDPNEYFTYLLSQICLYQNNGYFIMCGDLNARCGDEQDFIEGVDEVEMREIIDGRKNSYGDFFIDFLINSNCVMLNGRCDGINDFTSVSTKGLAVVDYAVVSQDMIHLCDNVKIIRAIDVFRQAHLTGVCDPDHNISDHSLVSWTMQIDMHNPNMIDNSELLPLHITKHDVSEVPADFMSDNQSISQLHDITEQCQRTDISSIDASYDQFCVIVKQAMNNSLPTRHIVINSEHKRGKHRYKPWWTERLTDLWKAVCEAEKLYCESDPINRQERRAQFIGEQRIFDRELRSTKREYWYAEQQSLLKINQTSDFWRKIGTLGINKRENRHIPWEIVRTDGSISSCRAEVLERWKVDYEQLLNPEGAPNRVGHIPDQLYREINAEELSTNITLHELRYALGQAKRGKALGEDMIPVEVLNNKGGLQYLLQLFNVCFTSGMIPMSWSKGIINPILKNPKDDPRDPLNYRGITMTSSVYKLFCSVLCRRLTTWIEENDIMCDEQNGFRTGRSTTDHLGSLTCVIETRIKKKQNTFAAFIDFSKAYDRIDRSLLWYKLTCIGVSDNMLSSLKSLYRNVQCTVRVNGNKSDWFEVGAGLKQGCILSPLLFNLFINDLVYGLNRLKCGLICGNTPLSVLLYADDIVLLSDKEEHLQILLNYLSEWCTEWGLSINFNKSKVIHFRTPSTSRTVYEFQSGNSTVDIVNQYKYLGLILTEHLDYQRMAKVVAQSASRALGLLISKDKAAGGMPFECYTKCYDCIVQATIDYGAPVWGTSTFSSIDAVQNRACRYFLGLGKYAPNNAVSGDMGWRTSQHKQWICVTRKWLRLLLMDDTLLTKKIFAACSQQANSKCRTWFYRVHKFFIDVGHEYVYCAENINVRLTISSIDAQLKIMHEDQWREQLMRDVAINGAQHGGNKLRTYRTFKQEYKTETYVQIIRQKKFRSAYAKFRCGVAPIKIETCRYGLNRVPVEERLCDTCQVVEDEYHVMMQCSLYNDIRIEYLTSICTINNNFNELSLQEQFKEIMSNPLYYKAVSKAMHYILNKSRWVIRSRRNRRFKDILRIKDILRLKYAIL